jgi:hypothetical protein
MSNNLFVVFEGHKVAGIYAHREDAEKHSQVIGGRMIVQELRHSTPVWVETMLAQARETAKIQNSARK